MKKIISLTKVMIKDTFNSISPNSKKNQKAWKKNIRILGIIGLYAILSIAMFNIAKEFLEVFIEAQQENLIIGTIFNGLTIYTLVIGTLTIPSIYYFSKDIEILLAMPIKAYEILFAKTITTYTNLLIGTSFIVIPFGITFQIAVSPPIYFLLFYLLAFLILPIIPLSIALILVVLVFRFIPKVNNKDIFTYISSFVVFAFVIAMQLSTGSDASIFAGLVSEDSVISQTVKTFLPTVQVLADAVNNYNIFKLLLVLAISLAIIYIVNKLIGGLYFKAAIGISEVSKKKSKKPIIVDNDDKRITTPIMTLIKSDFRNILRNPTFAINYLLPIFILPVFLLLPVITLFLSADIDMEMIQEVINMAQTAIMQLEYRTVIPFVIIISFLMTLFFSAMSTITSTSISREGENMEFFKTMPISMLLVIKSKLLLGIVISVLLPLIILIATSFILKLNILLILIGFISIIIAAIFSNILDIILDVFYPKLTWDNEVQAIKQNFLTIIPIFSTFLIVGLFLFIFIYFNENQLLSSILIISLATAISLIAYKVLIPKYGVKRLNNAIEEI